LQLVTILLRLHGELDSPEPLDLAYRIENKRICISPKKHTIARMLECIRRRAYSVKPLCYELTEKLRIDLQRIPKSQTNDDY